MADYLTDIKNTLFDKKGRFRLPFRKWYREGEYGAIGLGVAGCVVAGVLIGAFLAVPPVGLGVAAAVVLGAVAAAGVAFVPLALRTLTSPLKTAWNKFLDLLDRGEERAIQKRVDKGEIGNRIEGPCEINSILSRDAATGQFQKQYFLGATVNGLRKSQLKEVMTNIYNDFYAGAPIPAEGTKPRIFTKVDLSAEAAAVMQQVSNQLLDARKDVAEGRVQGLHSLEKQLSSVEGEIQQIKDSNKQKGIVGADNLENTLMAKRDQIEGQIRIAKVRMQTPIEVSVPGSVSAQAAPPPATVMSRPGTNQPPKPASAPPVTPAAKHAAEVLQHAKLEAAGLKIRTKEAATTAVKTGAEAAEKHLKR